MDQSIKVLKKEELELLKTPSDIKAWMDLLVRVSGEVFLWFLIINYVESRDWLLVVTLFFVVSVWHSFWGYAGLSHELFHGKVFTSKFMNKQVLNLANAFTWTNGVFFRQSHTLHHAKTFVAEDSEATSIQSWSLFAIIRYIAVDYRMLWTRVVYTIKNAVGIIPHGKLDESEIKAVQRVAMWILLFNLGVQVLLYFFFENIVVNVLFFLMPFTGQILNRMLAQSQHIGLSSQKDEGPLHHSRTIQLPWLLELLYAGMNYHCEHHLYPSVPYYNLNKVHKAIVLKGVSINLVKFGFLFNEFWKLVNINKV